MNTEAIPPDFKLSVVMPVFNEAKTVLNVIDRLRATHLPMEIIVVDDGSTDGTRQKLAELPRFEGLRVELHERNRGKGAALRTGFQMASGTAVVVQDADLEYDPQNLRSLIQPIIAGEADVVYGTRFGHRNGPVSPKWHSIANRFVSLLSNWRTGLHLSDVETCYKVIRSELIQQIAPSLKENRFGIEIELTIKLAREKARFTERPVSYARRGYSEGKKLGWRDAVRAIFCLVRY